MSPVSIEDPPRDPTALVRDFGVVPNDISSLPKDFAETWVQHFVKTYGRRPRILHIGNIANNAYVNSKLLNEIGWESDVVCYNYYHIMSYPEWEDADFEGQPTGAVYPNWSRVNLRGFKRPKWFAQGTLEHCVQYLIARRKRERHKALTSWIKLEFWRWLHSRHSQKLLDAFETAQRARRPGQFLIVVREIVKSRVPAFVWLPLKFAKRALFGPWRIDDPIKPPTAPPSAAESTSGNTTLQNGNEKKQSFERFKHLELEFRLTFPERSDILDASDLDGLAIKADQLAPLMEHYDIIQGYSTDAMFPLLVGSKRYVAYEHGTIREIPFEKNMIGQVTALAYAKADSIFMTNADSIPQALRLQPNRSKITFGLHGFDDKRLKKRLKRLKPKRFRFGTRDSTKLFFSPSRHDWSVKGNDRIIKAAHMLASKTRDFKIVFAEWGEDVSKSKQLIASCGLNDHFVWTKPLGKNELTMAYRDADAVIDQFLIPCIGSVTIEALSIGACPVLTSIDDDALTEFYGETIPLMNCSSVESIFLRMQEVTDSNDRNAEVRSRCSEWMDAHHSKERLLNHLALTYARVFADKPVSGGLASGEDAARISPTSVI